MGKRKILYIITKSNLGGAQRYVFELASSLSKEEFDVVVAFGGRGMLAEKLHKAGVRTRNVESFERDINLYKEVRSMIELFHIIREEKPDIIHLNSSKAGGSGAFIARLCGVGNIIFTAHGWPFFENRSLLWRSVVWFFSWLTALLAHKVILVSEHDRRKTRMPFVRRKLVMIHTAVPLIKFKAREKARAALFKEEVTIAHADDIWAVANSELTQNKNVFSLLEGARTFNLGSQRKLFLVLIGDGELRQEFETYVQNHGLRDSVVFTGYVDNARTHLKAFDVFLLPSFKEGLPYALLEAGAAGLFCIASDVGGIPEVIEHGKNGLLIDPKKPEAVRDALMEYTNLGTKSSTMKSALKKKVGSEFSIDTMLERTVELYRA